MMSRYFKQSIYRQYLLLFICFVTFFLVSSSLLSWYDYHQKMTYLEEIDELTNKQQIISDIEDNLNDILFEARGFLAFHHEQFLTKLEKEKETFEESLTQLETSTLTVEDLAYLQEVKEFYDFYFNDAFLQAAIFASENNQVALSEYSSAGMTKKVDEIRKNTENQTKIYDALILNVQKEYHENLTRSQFVFIGFILAFLLLFMFIGVRLAKGIGIPLLQIAVASDCLSKGEFTELKHTNREDELGALSRSFQNMAKSIQLHEQQLLAQNEELLAQQDELQSQQIELEYALEKMRANEQSLERRNEFNLSLANTYDQKELLVNIIENISSLMDADKACIVTLKGKIDYAYIGISENGMKQFTTHMIEDVLPKIYATKSSFSLTRLAVDTEKGYHEEAFLLTDLFIPVLSHSEEVVALIVLTRLGRSFTLDEEKEMRALSLQISVTLDKLSLYEKTEQALKVNQDIINSIREGIQLIDDHGRILQVNQQWSDMMNQDHHDQMKGLSIQRWLPMIKEGVPDHVELVAFMLGVIHEQRMDQEQVVYQTGTKNPRFVQVYYEAIYSGAEKLGTIFVHRDITNEYEVDRMKSELVSTVSHELRTPLSSVLGFTELMLNKELTKEKQRKYLSTIQNEAQRLTSLINDFLDVQRMEAGKQVYSMIPFNVEHMLEELVEAYSLQSSRHFISYHNHSGGKEMIGDQDRIKQVFTNLLSNAIKYSPKGGIIKLSSEVVNEQICITIEDEGLGIPKEAIPMLFNKFYRVDNTDRREIGGTGLGLAISKEILKAHQGNIVVESTLGKGSAFHITLPLRLESVTWLEENQVDAHFPSLVIVEDDESLALLLREELKESGFNVYHYRDGETALTKILEIEPDAIVIDILLGNGINGWKLIEYLKKEQSTEHIPIIISSALDEKERGLALGAKHYLTKPYQPSELSRVIYQTLMKRKKTGEVLIPKS